MRGSGLHHSSGSSSPNQGKMPRAYASRSRAVDRSAPAASNPFGLRNAFVTGGNASRTPNQGIINRRTRVRKCEGATVRAKVIECAMVPRCAVRRCEACESLGTAPVGTLAPSHSRTVVRTLAPSHGRTLAP